MRTTCTVALVAALAAAAVASTRLKWDGLYGLKWDNFHATWSPLGPLAAPLGKGFYSLPQTVAEAVAADWALARQEELLAMYCLPGDPRMCVLYDHKGSVAGVQISYLKADMSNSPYNWTQHSLFIDDIIFGEEVVGGRALFVDNDTLAQGRSSVEETGNSLRFQNGNGFMNVPLNESELASTKWTKESCIPAMGRHYYYDVSEEMDCQKFEPFFLLYDNHKHWLKGFGFQSFGRRSHKNREWEENVPAIAVKPTIPNAPQCLVDWISDYGTLSVHVYLTSKPMWYLCL